MPVILVCAPSPLDGELVPTILGRTDVERHQAGRFEEGLSMAVAARPDLVLIDRRLPRAGELVGALRREPSTRGCSVAVVATGDFEPAEVELLEAGANAILRFPAGPHWDDRLDRLLNVPARREARVPVEFAVEAIYEGGASVGNALNLSIRGMLMQSPVPLAIGDEIRFAFRLQDASVDGRGRVVRHGGGTSYGILFEALSADHRNQILRFVGTRS
jgi:CheY-like chemotaxis protein